MAKAPEGTVLDGMLCTPERGRGAARMGRITIAADDVHGSEAAELMGELQRELLGRYPAENVHGFQPEELEAGRGVFLIARLDGDPVGCGVVRALGDGIGEIKRMYVRPSARRLGIARALLEDLERHGRALGFHALRLETGERQPEANALYERAGYRPIPPFGEYVSDPMSLCFEKVLMTEE